ncbi:MAG: Gfo/Idh/MocA family oxidoreductase [Granulosicoccus sp.]|nr:Gfo/Idh/MocA family oxidoreductase [Granulosicoccus sp.]
MEHTLTIAIAGFGWWGQHMARRLSSNARFTVAAIIEPDEARTADITAAGLSRLPSIEAALEDKRIEAIVLTTPNTLHEQQVIQIAGAGLHVFCEKPLGLTGASAKRSVAACEKANVILGIGHERRFEPAMMKVKTMIDQQTLGTIMHAEAAFSHDKLINVEPGDWRTLKATAPAAAMTGMGIHLTDFYISMFGPVSTVQAITGHRVLDWETGDVVTVQLKFQAGMTATLSAILYTPHFIRLHVFGSDAWVEVRNNTHPDTPGGIAELVVSRTNQEMETEQFAWTDTVVDNLESFADAVADIAPYPYTHQELVHNIEVLEAITQSAESGETIHLA